MELSPEVRKKAVEAFKQELISAFQALRDNLSRSPLDWKGKENKMLLHRIKGGSSFLGYISLATDMAELESEAISYPIDVQKWFDLLNTWEAELIKLS